MELRFYLRRPTKPAAGYGITCYEPLDRKRKRYHGLAPELADAVSAINSQYLSGALQPYQAETMLQDLIATQYAKAGLRSTVLKRSVLSKANQDLFDKYWHQVYEAKELADPSSMRYDLLRALKAIEPLSLMSATPTQLKQALNKHCTNVNKHRRAVDRLNQLLKWLKRDVRLEKPEEDLLEPVHITWPELQRVLPRLSSPVLRDLAVTLFGTGMRLGEAMAIEPGDLSGSRLNVVKQITAKGKRKKPKRGKKGRVVVLPACLKAVERWASVADKMVHREPLQIELKRACLTLFPKNKSKHCSPHDLRHSHAIHMLSHGCTLTEVRSQLRNRIEVCEKYYTGYEHTDGSLSHLEEKLKKGKKKPPNPKA